MMFIANNGVILFSTPTSQHPTPQTHCPATPRSSYIWGLSEQAGFCPARSAHVQFDFGDLDNRNLYRKFDLCPLAER